tara:strand:- start:4536 stop:5780 length:1245 start_codon:yes stop_codon:yes gene_type:complete
MENNMFKWNRFDLPIKFLFLKFYDKDINSSFADDMYKEHLRLWNGFNEYDNPNKNSYEKFRDDFIKIFVDIENNNFDWNKSPIVLDSENYLINGAHRTAAAMYLDTNYKFRRQTSIADGQKICDYNLFSHLGLSEEYMDAAALEFVRRNKNLLLVNLFPAADHSRSQVDSIISKHGNIFYKKNIKLNNVGSLNYMFQLYKGEKWAGNYYNQFAGFKEKQSLCFTSEKPMIVYLIDTNNKDSAIELKKDLRSLYNIGNHSVHINDTHEETLRLSRSIFNKNSIHFLNNCKISNFEKFQSLLNNYEDYISNNNLDIENYCITASSVLSAYGLREGKDLDYLHFGRKLDLEYKDINSHNQYGIGRYSKNIDDIIFNPRNHFYYGNIKFASLDIIEDLKEKRKEPKDYIDLDLIRSIK